MDMNKNFIHIWKPLDVFKETDPPKSDKAKTKLNSENSFALIILNQPITANIDFKLIKLWQQSSVRFCVDGGTNRFYEWQQKITRSDQLSVEQSKAIQDFYPDYICGDLDSIDLEILEIYKARGSKHFRLHNQNLNDFEKTLRFAVNCVRHREIDSDLMSPKKSFQFSLCKEDIEKLVQTDFDQIYSVVNFSGRVDHCIANMNSLYNKCIENIDTFILSEESITFLLRDGINIIYTDNQRCRGKYCGFFPLGQEALVNTYGLKWNITHKRVKFGSFVSSSNEFSNEMTDEEREFVSGLPFEVDVSKEHVIIQTDQPLIWTMSIL